MISFALVQEYISLDYKERLRQMYSKAGFQVNGDTIALPTQEPKNGHSNTTSNDSQKRNISAVTRRDIIDKLCSLKIEGRLDLIEFLRMTWPELDSMPSSASRASLKDDIIRHIYTFPDWEHDYLLYQCLKLGDCTDELFTAFLASCLHPLVRSGKKEVAELLSFFNEALGPDGYVLKPASMQSGRPIYAAFTFGTNDQEYIVPRAIEIIEQLARNFHLIQRSQQHHHQHTQHGQKRFAPAIARLLVVNVRFQIRQRHSLRFCRSH